MRWETVKNLGLKIHKEAEKYTQEKQWGVEKKHSSLYSILYSTRYSKHTVLIIYSGNTHQKAEENNHRHQGLSHLSRYCRSGKEEPIIKISIKISWTNSPGGQYLIKSDKYISRVTIEMSSIPSASNAELRLQQQIVRKTRPCDAEGVTIMGMPRVADIEELLERLKAFGIILTDEAAEIIQGEARRPSAGGQHPFAFYAADPSAILETDWLDVRLPCLTVTFTAARNYQELTLELTAKQDKRAEKPEAWKKAPLKSKQESIRGQVEGRVKGRGRGPRTVPVLRQTDIEDGEPRQVVYVTQQPLKLFYDLDQIAGGGTLGCDVEDLTWIRVLRMDSLSDSALAYLGDLRMAVGHQVAEVLGNFMITDRGSWEFPGPATKDLEQWVAYWYQHMRVDLKREFQTEVKEFVTVVLVSLAMEPDTMHWSKDIAHRLLTLLPPVLGMVPGQQGSPWKSAPRNSVITKCEAYIVRAIMVEPGMSRPSARIRAPHIYTRVSIHAVPNSDMTITSYFQSVVASLRAIGIGIYPLYVGFQGGKDEETTMVVDTDRTVLSDIHMANEALAEMAQMHGGVRFRITDIRAVKVAMKQKERAPLRPPPRHFLDRPAAATPQMAKETNWETGRQTQGREQSGQGSAELSTPSTGGTDAEDEMIINPRKRSSAGGADATNGVGYVAMLPHADSGVGLYTDLFTDAGELTEIAHACAIETYLRVASMPQEGRAQQIKRMIHQIQAGTGALTVAEIKSQLAALERMANGEDRSLGNKAELTIAGIAEIAQRRFLAAYRMSTTEIQIRVISPEGSTEQGWTPAVLEEGSILPLFGPEGHVTLVRIGIDRDLLLRAI